MDIGNLLAIVSIIASLVSVPFIAQGVNKELQGKYTSAGSLLLDIGESEVKETPQTISGSYGPDKLEKEMNTPFGRFKFSIESGKVYQELERPDRRVVVFETPDQIEWILYKQEISLRVVRKNSTTIIENCTTPNGTITKIKESGTIKMTKRGVGLDGMEEECKTTETILKSEVERMEGMKKQMLDLPPNIVINEFVSDPKENETEWIELFNKEMFNVNLSNWELCDDHDCYSLAGTLSAGEYLVLNRTTTGLRLTNYGDIIRLRKGEKIVDKVAYGTYDDENVKDNAPTPDKGKSTGRCPDGADTGIDNVDFIMIAVPTPGEENNCTSRIL